MNADEAALHVATNAVSQLIALWRDAVAMGIEPSCLEQEMIGSFGMYIKHALSLITAEDRSNQASEPPEEWRKECQEAAFCMAMLVRLAKRSKWSEYAVIEALRTMPHSNEEVDKPHMESLFVRLALDAHRYSLDDPVLSVIMKYFHDRLIPMSPDRRAMLEASMAGILTGIEMA